MVPIQAERRWFVVDARGKVLGRLASRLATVLRGKEKVSFAPHLDEGDFVVVVNAAKVSLTGQKLDNKLYRSHSGYPGGLKTLTARQMLSRHPEDIIRKAVWGMMPKNKLSRQVIKKLKIYAGPDHPHEAQRPEPMEISEG